MNQPLLKCEHVDFGYENYDVVKDVSMEINPGDYLCIVGENGSGKSTLMKGLLGLIKPTGGVLTLADELRRSGIGYLPQQTPAQKDFPATVQEVVISGCLGKRGNRPFYSMEERKLAAVNMEKLGITDLKKSCYRDLSGGQKQRTLIARALCATDKLLILDEATSGLDPVMRDEMLEVFWDFVQDEEHSILMSSHITTDLERIADRITFLHRGKLLFCKPKDELLDRYGILRCGAADFAKIDKADILACRREDCQWSVLVADKEAARRKYRPQVLDDATIDDILLLYVKGEQNR